MKKSIGCFIFAKFGYTTFGVYMNFKGLFYYIFIWLLPVLSAIYAFFVDSVGLGITLLIFSIITVVYMVSYLKSIKTKIKGGYLVINKGRMLKQTFLTPKESIVCIKTIVFKIIRASSIVIIAPNVKIFIPFISAKQIEKIIKWYKEKNGE